MKIQPILQSYQHNKNRRTTAVSRQQFTGNFNQTKNATKTPLGKVTSTISTFFIGLLWTNNNEDSEKTKNNLKNEKEIYNKFLERYHDSFISNKIIPHKYNSLKKHHKNHHKFILECMIHEEIPVTSILKHLFYTPPLANSSNIFKNVTNLIQNFPDFPPELINKAICFCEEQYFKNAEELYNELNKHYKFNEKPVTTVKELKEQLLKNPSLYLNHEEESPSNTQKEKIKDFFVNSYEAIHDLSWLLGKETMDVFFRKRLNNVQNYIDIWHSFTDKDVNLFSKMIKCSKPDGNQLDANTKIEFINIIKTFKEAGFAIKDIEQLIENGITDIDTIEIKLFKKILKMSGLEQEFIDKLSTEELKKWNLQFAHKLANSIKNDKFGFSEVLKISMTQDFKNYITSSKTAIGKANAETKKSFINRNLNYDKWINPNKSLEIKFITQNNDSEQLKHIAYHTIKDIETLQQTPAVSKLIKKRFPKNISKDGKFIIPQEIYATKQNLEKFLKNLYLQLDDVWQQAFTNSIKQDNTKALATLTTRDHIKSYIESLQDIKDNQERDKAIDWTIKMWDRNPQKDLFQGNFSTCCIGMGNTYGEYMIDYLTSTAFNMIEFVDNKTGQTVGNALCYLADTDKGTAFIIDNVEINNNKALSSNNGIEFRTALTKYAENVSREINNEQVMPIYIGTTYNDIPDKDLKSISTKLKFIGTLRKPEIYLDVFPDATGSIVDTWDLYRKKECKLYKLN